MNTDLSLSLSKNWKKWITVEVLCLIALLANQSTMASTGSSWSKKASWANDKKGTDPSEEVHTSIQSPDTSPQPLSPFAPGSHNLAVDLGQVFLMVDLTKYTNSIGTQFHYTYGVSDLFAFDSSLGYSEHSNGNFSMASLLTGMRMNLSWYDKVVPHLIAGLGFYRPYYRNVNMGDPSNSSISSILFGLHFGPGIDLELSRNVFFGASLTFHGTFGANQVLADGSNFNIGGSYTSFFIHTGLTF